MNLQRLQLLAEFRRLGTVTAVAEVKLITHSAVSQQLAQLEKETGYTLMVKSGRGLRLTDRGQLLADYAEKITGLVNEAQAALADRTAVTGILRIACFQTALASLSAPTTKILNHCHPNLKVEFVLADVIDGMKELEDNRVDLTIGEQFPGAVPIGNTSKYDTSNRIERQDFYNEPLVLVCPDQGTWQQQDDLRDMRDYPFMLNPAYTPAGIWERSVCHDHGFEPHVILESPAPLLQLQLVSQGLGVAFLPSLVLSEATTGFRVSPLPGNPTRTLFSAVRAGMENHPKITAFRFALHAALDEATNTKTFCAF